MDEELKNQFREISGDCLQAHLNFSVNLVCVTFLVKQLKAIELSRLTHTCVPFTLRVPIRRAQPSSQKPAFEVEAEFTRAQNTQLFISKGIPIRGSSL